MQLFSTDVLKHAMRIAFPTIHRTGRVSAPFPEDLATVFATLAEAEYVMVGLQPKYDDKRDLSALATVGAFNRAATREGLRKQGCLLVLRTIPSQVEGEGSNIALYIGRDTERVTALDNKPKKNA